MNTEIIWLVGVWSVMGFIYAIVRMFLEWEDKL